VGRTNPSLVSLTAPVRVLLTVAGGELRKDGGNETGPGFRAAPTGEPKSRLESRNPVCGFNSKPLCQE